MDTSTYGRHGAAWSKTLPLSGGTLTGALLLNSDPSSALGAATRQYVDSKAGTGNFLPITGGEVTGPSLFSASGVALSVGSDASVGGTLTAFAGNLNGANNTTRQLQWSTNGSARWRLQADGNETGSNAGSLLRLFGYADAGNAIGEVARFDRSTGSVTWNNNVSYANPVFLHKGVVQATSSFVQTGTKALVPGTAMSGGGANPMGQYMTITYTGTLDTGAAPYFNFWNVTDTVNAARPLVMSQMLNLSHSYNTGANSDRIQFGLTFDKNAASADGLYTQCYSIWAHMHFDVGESQTPGTYLSRASVANFDCRIGGSGNYVTAIAVQENDIRLYAGNQALTKVNLALNTGVGDAVHGIDEDAALKFTRSPLVPDGTGGQLNLIQVGGASANWPLDPTVSGTSFFHIQQNNPNARYGNLPTPWLPKVGVGFDCYGALAGTAMFRTAGLTIDGKGQLSVLGPGAVTYSTGGIKISVPNVCETSATVASGGAAYRVGDYVTDQIGGLWVVTAISGAGTVGSVTAVALDTPGYANAAPSGPVTMTGGNGAGLTLNIVATNTGALNLGDVGQTLGFNGSTAIAKPTITGDRGGVSGLTSLLSQLSSYGLVNDATTPGTGGSGGVTSFNTRTGAVTLASADVTGALGYTPYNAANPSNYQTDTQVASAVGSAVSGYIPLAQRAAVNGVATLDATGVVPTAQLPGAVTGTLTYLGGWNASTNTPVLASGALSGGVLQTAGRYYLVTVGATTAAIDGTTTWVAGDWASSNGTVWQRVQNSTSPYLPLAGGTLTGAVTLGSDTWQTAPSEPDIAWSIRGTNGNMPVMLDQAGVLSAASLTAGALSATTFSAGAVTFTSATIANELIADQAMPDLIGAVMGSNGNVVAGYDVVTGEFNAVSVNAGTVKINGAAIPTSFPKSPTDTVDVTAAPYNAVGDGVESFCYSTISGTSLTISNYTGTITLTQLNPTTARLVIVTTANSGIAFQGYDVGRTLWLDTGTYQLQAVITRFWDTNTVDMAAAGITPQSAVSATVTWPCFLATDVGKYMVIDGAGKMQMFTNAATRVNDTSAYATAFVTTISAVVSPVQVTLAVAPPVTWTAVPARLRWGTNDANAIVLAGQAAYAQQKRKLYFPGDGKLYLLLGLVASSIAYPVSYGLVATTEAAAAVNGCLWLGDNSRVYACDIGGLAMPHTIAQVQSDPGKAVAKKIFGRASFPRCSKLTTINLLIMGDSQATYGPQSQYQAVGQAHHFAYYFRMANPGKTINVYDIAMGGSTFESTDANPTMSESQPPVSGWVVPRPISGARGVLSWIPNINQTSTSATAPIVPDCVAILDNGGNDGQGINTAAMTSIINQIRAVAHADGNGPTDVVMMTDNLAVMTVTNLGNGSGNGLPAIAPSRWGDDFAAGIIRTMAVNQGFGCIDLAGEVQRTCFGYDETVRRLRITPQWTVTGSAASPITLPQRTCHYSLFWKPTAANDAAAWTAMQELRFGLSQQLGNDAIMRLGPNGNIWTATTTSGMRVPTVCTIGAGSTSLTVAAPTTFSGITFSTKYPTPILYTPSGAIFTSGMVPSMMTLPTGQGGRTQRDFLRGFVDGSNVMRLFCSYSNADYTAQSGTITVGGAHFFPQDGTSCPDIVIFYADGTIFQTRVAYGGYVSQTQVTLVDPAPQALAGATVQVFIGRMGKRWADSGFNVSGRTSAVGVYTVDIQRDAVLFGYGDLSKPLTGPVIANLIGAERYGASYYPVITPANSQELTLTNIYVDAHRTYLPTATPWEVRGQSSGTSQSYYLGGVSGHPASPLMSDIQIPFYASQDLTT